MEFHVFEVLSGVHPQGKATGRSSLHIVEDGESYNTWKKVIDTVECCVGTSIVTKRWDVCSRTKTFKSALDKESLGSSFLVVGQREGP